MVTVTAVLKSDGLRWISSAAAVYSVALTSSAAGQRTPASPPRSFNECSREMRSGRFGGIESGREAAAVEVSGCREKFAPRFDGLKFIETLVTAHR